MRFPKKHTKLSLVIIALIASFVLTACAVDTKPRIDNLVVERVMDQASQVTLAAKVSDPNNDLQSVTIRWGDGSSEQINSNFQTIQLSHSYTVLDKTYTVELEAVDLLAGKAIDSVQVGVSSIAPSCQDITAGIEFCYDVLPDLLTANVSLKAFDNTLYEDTLSVNNPSVEFFVPVVGGIGQAKVKVTGELSASGGENAVRVQVFACVSVPLLPPLCTGEIANERIVF